MDLLLQIKCKGSLHVLGQVTVERICEVLVLRTQNLKLPQLGKLQTFLKARELLNVFRFAN